MRKTFGTGSVWEQTLGYSRAVQVDNTLYISATAASGEDGIVGEDFYTQTQYILQKLGKVLADARALNPERFTTTTPPKILALPDTAWINKPEDPQPTETPAA